MNDNPKMWIGNSGEDNWREVGEVTDLDVSLKYDPPDIKDFDPGAPITQIQDSYIVDLKLTSNVDDLLEMMRRYVGAVTPAEEQLYRSVMVVGTRKLAHVHPGPRQRPVSRAEHTRARKLYSERLRRDRRRKRKGRAPILRSGPNVRALFPRVTVEDVRQRGDVLGMRMVTSPHLDAGTVAMFDTQLLDRCIEDHRPPKIFDYDRPGLKHMVHDYLGFYPPQRTLGDVFKFTGLDPS